MTALEELVALVNARLPAGIPYPFDPATTRVERWAEHYWSITDGRSQSVWQQAVPQHPRWPVWDPYIVWTEDPTEALERILAVERRRAAGIVTEDFDALAPTLRTRPDPTPADERERAAIVAWLRAKCTDTRDAIDGDNAVSATYAVAAARIERGDHWGKP